MLFNNKQYDQSIYHGRYRYWLLALAEIQMLLITGIVFGWSPLENEMENQGVFSYLCENGETTCNEQSLRLNLVYTLGAFTATGSAFFSGALFDKYGPIWTSLAAMIIMIAGCVCWYVSHLINDNLYILAFSLLGIGGPACQVSLIHICNLFPSMYSSISSSFSGMFVGSSFVFKIFSVVASKYHISIATLFLYYIIVVVVLFLPGLLMMHHSPYLPYDEIQKMNSINQTNDEIIDNTFQSPNNQQHIIVGEEPSISNANEDDDDRASLLKKVDRNQLKEVSLIHQLISWEFILLVLFMSINSLHSIFYIGIVNNLFPQGSIYIDIFNYSWNGGLVLVPLVGYVMIKSSLALNSLYIMICGIIFGVFSSIPNEPVQYVTFFFVSLQNVYIWGYFFIYLSIIFGYNNYGKLMGISSIITALIGLFQYLLTYLMLNVIKYFWINIALTILKVVLLIFPWKLYLKYKNQ